MAIWRVIYKQIEDWKLMRIYEVPEGQAIAIPKTCTKMLNEDWQNSIDKLGTDQDVVDMLKITEVQDMR